MLHNISKLVMMAGIVLASLTVKAQTDDGRVYGQWMSHEGQLLKMKYDDTFERFETDRSLVATGEFECRDNQIFVTKEDDEYRLHFAIKGDVLVVSQPYQNDKAWLFYRIAY